MRISKRVLIRMVIFSSLFSLFVGCSGTSSPANEKSLKSLENNEAKTVSQPLEFWIGDYTFSEFAPQNQNMFYRFTIYKDDGNYYAEISIDGFQTVARLKAKVAGDEKYITLLFDKYLPNNIFEPYVEGEVLLNFEKNNSQLYTYWGGIQPILESNKKSGKIYFVVEP